MKHITVLSFPSQLFYCSANEIEKYLGAQGVYLPIDDKGSTHPGTVFNEALRVIYSNPVKRKLFGVKPSSLDVVECTSTEGKNVDIQKYMVNKGYIHRSTIKNGDVDLYSIKAATAIVSEMVGKVCIIHDDVVIDKIDIDIIVKPKKLAGKSSRPKNSLFCSPVKKYRTVMDMLTKEEQDAVRKYEKLVKQTRYEGTRQIRNKNGKGEVYESTSTEI